MSENNIDINNNIQDDDIPKSETNNSNSQDSFNKDLQKKLEEYKKSEPRIPHRPISSYTSKRNFNQVNKEIEQDNNKIPNKPQSAQTKSNNNSKNSNKKNKSNSNGASNNNNDELSESDLTVEQVLQDLNNF